MKISKTFKIDESTMNQIKNLSANLDLPQGDVIDRAITLLTVQAELQKENDNKNIKIVTKSHPITTEKLASVKESGYIILELKFGAAAFAMHSLLQVTSCNGVYGKARFIDVREGEKHKTFETFDEYKGVIIDFSLSDVWDYTDSLN